MEQIVFTRAASLSNYAGMVVLLDVENRVCLGRLDHYDNHGHYDNADGSLMFISHNRRMFDLLSYKPAWVLPQSAMIEHGFFTVEDFREYDQLSKTRLAMYQQCGKVTFDGQPFVPPHPGEQSMKKPRRRVRGPRRQDEPER